MMERCIRMAIGLDHAFLGGWNWGVALRCDGIVFDSGLGKDGKERKEDEEPKRDEEEMQKVRDIETIGATRVLRRVGSCEQWQQKR